MKQLIKGFTQFVNENHMADMNDMNDMGREAVATAYSGNSNEEMLRLTFSNKPGKEVLISLDSLANVLDDSVLDSASDEDQEAIHQALWTRAQEIAKRAGCSVLIDNESDTEIDLTGRASNPGYSASSMDMLEEIKMEIENQLPEWNTSVETGDSDMPVIYVENPEDPDQDYYMVTVEGEMATITKGTGTANAPSKMVPANPRSVAKALAMMIG
jgi:hypothetical protein